jgi:ribonuclease R
LAKPRSKTAPFPSKQELLDFIRASPVPVGKREIARAFHIRGPDRAALKAILRELQEEGHLDREDKRRVSRAGGLPEVLVVEVAGPDPDGELLARPAVWRYEGSPPKIYMAPERRGRPALEAGDRALVRLRRVEADAYEGRTIRVLGGVPRHVLGIYERGERGGRLRPTDRRAKTDFVIRSEDASGARPGELVLAELKPRHPRLGLREVVVLERLGHLGDSRALSLISIHEHDIPNVFGPEALAEAEAAGPASLGRREDLRGLPLVTIDGADARDFDDAVWAAPDDDPKAPGGWHIVVAIADVAHYVHPDSALDRAAYERGNSVYFPDRVVPMLPEALSNGWCSLRPGEERPCLAAHLWLDAEGRIRRHRFARGLMRSAARLTYEQVQAARDGNPDEVAGPLLEAAIVPLYGAFEALAAARERRGTLDLELPERQVLLDEEGKVTGIVPRQRLDSHRLVEEFMIAANVAAAETLEARHQPCMYRVHDAPDPQKLDALREVLASFGVKLVRGQVIKPRAFTQILKRVAATPYAAMVNELVLRAQSQAAYAPDNLGHFGLALPRYAHFTSPIRRYADLLVHRALIAGLDLGRDGLPAQAGAGFAEAGRHISTTERRAQAAEREAVDRFTAAFLQDQLGQVVTGRITGVTRFGLFVQLSDSGADGLVPISTLPDDFYHHDEAGHRLVGRRWGRVYGLGETVAARLSEADPITGGIVLRLLEDGQAGEAETGGTASDQAGETGGWHPLDAGRRKAGGPAVSAGRKTARRPGGKPGRRGGGRR